MRPIDLIVIHCSASPNGRWTTNADIDAWHKARGFHREYEWRVRQCPNLEAIGYHFVIYTNGGIALGRHIDEIGAHAEGHNAHSIGICLVGTDRFSPAQWKALSEWLASARKKWPDARVVGHRELPDVHKDCPGFSVADWLKAGPAPEHVLEVAPHE